MFGQVVMQGKERRREREGRERERREQRIGYTAKHTN